MKILLPETHTIYAICIIAPNGKYRGVYTGSAKNGRSRQKQHLNFLHKGIHENSHLQRAWNKYGIGAFSFKLLEEVDNPTELIETEQFWIDAFINEFGRKFVFNICLIAGSRLGHKQSPDTRKKIGLRHKGKTISTETRNKISEAGKRRFAMSEEREKISKARLGYNPSTKARENMSIAQRLRHSENPLNGISWSKEKKKYLVRVTINGHLKHVSYSESIDEAIKARNTYLSALKPLA